MNSDALGALGRNALAWAKCYTALVEALMREGVPEEIARAEARKSATAAAFAVPLPGIGCPSCGARMVEVTAHGMEFEGLCLTPGCGGRFVRGSGD
jgi:hypothetical protein